MSELSASEGDPDVSVCVELIDLPVNGSAIPITVSISNIINIGAMRCNLMNYARSMSLTGYMATFHIPLLFQILQTFFLAN